MVADKRLPSKVILNEKKYKQRILDIDSTENGV